MVVMTELRMAEKMVVMMVAQTVAKMADLKVA